MNSFVTSLRKNYIGIIIILIASLFTSVGQLLWKMSNGAEITYLIMGFVCYGLGAILMIISFRFGSFSVIHPMLSFGYVFAILLGYLILRESINPIRLLGVGIIIAGVVFIGGGDD